MDRPAGRCLSTQLHALSRCCCPAPASIIRATGFAANTAAIVRRGITVVTVVPEVVMPWPKRAATVRRGWKIGRVITGLLHLGGGLGIGGGSGIFGSNTRFFEVYTSFLLTFYAHAFPLICDRIVVRSGIGRSGIIVAQLKRFYFARGLGRRGIGEVRNTLVVNPTMNGRRRGRNADAAKQHSDQSVKWIRHTVIRLAN